MVPYAGLPLSALNDQQKRDALELIRLYIGHMRDTHAQIKMTNIIKHWDRTYFAWIGTTDADAVFYYRIHSPVVMIEYDHQTPVALDGPRCLPVATCTPPSAHPMSMTTAKICCGNTC